MFTDVAQIKSKYYISLFDDDVNGNILLDIFNGNLDNYTDNPVYYRTIGLYYKFVLEDNESALKYLKLAEENGNINVYYSLGNYYHDLKQTDEAIKYHELAVSNNIIDSARNLGYIYEYDMNDFEKAKSNYLKAAEKGDTFAMSHLSSLYIKQNKMVDAIKYCKMAIELGDSRACGNLGHIYFEHNRGVRNYEKAMEYFRLGYSRADLLSTYYLSRHYRTVEYNLDEYFKYVRDFKKQKEYTCKQIIENVKEHCIYDLTVSFTISSYKLNPSSEIFMEFVKNICKHYYDYDINDSDNAIEGYNKCITILNEADVKKIVAEAEAKKAAEAAVAEKVVETEKTDDLQQI